MKSYELEIQYCAVFEKLSRQSWSEMNIQQREQVLQQVENFAALQENRPAAVFRLDYAMKFEKRGYYDTDANMIVQNIRCIEDDNPDIAVKNVLHEGRHAYQYDCIMHPERHTEVKETQIAEWREGFQNYVSTDVKKDYQAYFMQTVEKDARKFANKYYKSYLNGHVLKIAVKKLQNQEDAHMWGKAKKNGESKKESKMQVQTKNTQQSESPFLKQRKEFMDRVRVTPEQQKQESIKYCAQQKNNNNSNNNGNERGARDRTDDHCRRCEGHTR